MPDTTKGNRKMKAAYDMQSRCYPVPNSQDDSTSTQRGTKNGPVLHHKDPLDLQRRHQTLRGSKAEDGDKADPG